MTLGFVVGKFYPPHRGHKYLIEAARAQVDRLVVMIAHHPSQSIPGELRAAWLAEIHPDCEVHLVPDELEDDHVQWAEFTLRHLGRPPDVVFSSEDYGPEFARLMGARHVSVEGHTDAKGATDYNQALSERRAGTVRDWLVRRGAVPAGTPMVGYGESRPVAPNVKPDGSDDPEGRAKNRRVEVVLDTCDG